MNPIVTEHLARQRLGEACTQARQARLARAFVTARRAQRAETQALRAMDKAVRQSGEAQGALARTAEASL